MKRLITSLLVLLLCYSCTAPANVVDNTQEIQNASMRSYETSKDVVWRSVISAINERQFNIISSDQSSGIIKASRTISNRNADTQRIMTGVSTDSGTTFLTWLIEEIKPGMIDVKLNISGQLNTTDSGVFGIENKRSKTVSNIMTVDVLNKWFGLVEHGIDRRK